MSVLIKGLKMPKRCGECIFDVSGVGGCIINLNTEPKNKLTHSCPLIELPDHGDLIDRDALIKRLRDYACKPCKEYGADKNGDRCEWCSFDDAFARIEKAKKVIPAERSEDG